MRTVDHMSTAAPPDRAAVVKQARIWIAQTFYGTLLRQMHASAFRSELFSGGRGGQAFSSLLDQHLTQRMAGGGATGSLAESIAGKIASARAGPAANTSFQDNGRRTHVAPAGGA